ncbi:hypothetical protein [Streptomyces fuscichromogenes]|nr:hypothetical protein [Streptomyces fuscichromogenes]
MGEDTFATAHAKGADAVVRRVRAVEEPLLLVEVNPQSNSSLIALPA